MKKILPTIVTGFSAAVLSTVPVLKGLSCCLLVPLASVFALFLDMKANKNFDKIILSKAILYGFLTGLFVTIFFVLFDLMITLLTKTNDFVESLPQSELLLKELNLGNFAEEPLKLMRSIASEIKTSGFSVLYAIMIFLSNFITNSIFGILGGVVGMSILNKKREKI
jgi:hypothetical protein